MWVCAIKWRIVCVRPKHGHTRDREKEKDLCPTREIWINFWREKNSLISIRGSMANWWRFRDGISLISRLKGSSRHFQRGVQKFVCMSVVKMCSMRRKVSTNFDRALHLNAHAIFQHEQVKIVHLAARVIKVRTHSHHVILNGLRPDLSIVIVKNDKIKKFWRWFRVVWNFKHFIYRQNSIIGGQVNGTKPNICFGRELSLRISLLRSLRTTSERACVRAFECVFVRVFCFCTN